MYDARGGGTHECTYLLENVAVDPKKRLSRSHWIFLIKGKKSEMRSSIRLYSRHMIEELLGKAGFVVKGVWCDTKGSSYKKSKSPRLAVLAQKTLMVQILELGRIPR